ncbi:MAG: hypothetical protein BZY88_05285 [SAR202 cluster bacterium Io17-Chloro-G9]|nr:MAG: hypothetical protein BZY88_05285 [SAR202 cluster bacterium Io17-Chloro-G9]
MSAARLPWGIHYAWVIVAVLAVVQVFGASIFMVAGIMVPPLSDPEGDFGWSVGTIGAAIAVYYFFSAVFAPISGALGDRFGVRRMMLAGIIFYGFGMSALGFITEIWHFFLLYGVFLSLTQSISMVPMMVSVSGWFRRHLGLGIGILWTASGLGSAFLAPLIGGLLESPVGWKGTFLIIAVIGTGSMILVYPFLRNRPADVGIKPYGARDNDPPPVVRPRELEKLRAKVFNQTTRRTKAFWNLPLVHALGCAGHGIVLIWAIPLAVQQGLTLAEAAGIVTIISLVSLVSRFSTPILAEMYGPRKMMAASLAIQGLTVLILFWAQDLWAFYLFAAAFGVGFGGEWTGYLVINRKYFGDGPMGSVYGWQMTGALMGHAVTTALSGLVILATGSFYPVFVLSIVFSLGGVAVIALLDSTSHSLIPDWEELLPLEARSAPAPASAAGDS